MNKDILAGNWKQLSGKIKEEWGKFTDDEITEIGGQQEKLIGRLQEKYGFSKDEAENAIDKFYKKHRND